MSLVATYVQATDGKIYKEPVLSGEDFFICFDDDDPPELVIKVLDRTDKQLHQRAINILKDIGLVATISDAHTKSGRLFGKSNKFVDSYSVFLSIKAPIPADKITEHEGFYDGKSECTLYTWKK
jgi:hypothetical protein